MNSSLMPELITKLSELGDNNLKANQLEKLENLFQVSRSCRVGLKDFVEELTHASFWQNQYLSNNPYLTLCLGLASRIDEHHNNHKNFEPSYHSREHFQDVCLALTVLLEQSPTSEPSSSEDAWHISHQEAWLLLFCAIAHDFGHTGATNQAPFELERLSVQKTRAFLRDSAANPDLKNDLGTKIEPIILATDPAFLGTLLAKFTGPAAKLNKIDCLSMLMVEADLLASALPTQGKMLGKLLAQEWASSNPQGAVTVASDQGRLKFLQYIRFVSPYAMMLKMEDIRNHSIEQLKN